MVKGVSLLSSSCLRLRLVRLFSFLVGTRVPGIWELVSHLETEARVLGRLLGVLGCVFGVEGPRARSLRLYFRLRLGVGLVVVVWMLSWVIALLVSLVVIWDFVVFEPVEPVEPVLGEECLASGFWLALIINLMYGMGTNLKLVRAGSRDSTVLIQIHIMLRCCSRLFVMR